MNDDSRNLKQTREAASNIHNLSNSAFTIILYSIIMMSTRRRLGLSGE